MTIRAWSFHIKVFQDFHGGSVEWILPANAGNTDFIPGLGRCHMLWSYKVHGLHLLSLCSGALKSWLLKPACSRLHEPQLKSPRAATTEARMSYSQQVATTETASCNYRSPCTESSAMREATALRSPCITTKSPPAATKTQCSQKYINKAVYTVQKRENLIKMYFKKSRTCPLKKKEFSSYRDRVKKQSTLVLRVLRGGCKELDPTERLNWTEINNFKKIKCLSKPRALLPWFLHKHPLVSFPSSSWPDFSSDAWSSFLLHHPHPSIPAIAHDKSVTQLPPSLKLSILFSFELVRVSCFQFKPSDDPENKSLISYTPWTKFELHIFVEDFPKITEGPHRFVTQLNIVFQTYQTGFFDLC